MIVDGTLDEIINAFSDQYRPDERLTVIAIGEADIREALPQDTDLTDEMINTAMAVVNDWMIDQDLDSVIVVGLGLIEEDVSEDTVGEAQ